VRENTAEFLLQYLTRKKNSTVWHLVKESVNVVSYAPLLEWILKTTYDWGKNKYFYSMFKFFFSQTGLD